MLDGYGSIGITVDREAHALVRRVLEDSEAATHGWCIGNSNGRDFIAQVFVGHQATGTGVHMQAYWKIDSLTFLSFVAVADSDSLAPLMHIAESIEIPANAQ